MDIIETVLSQRQKLLFCFSPHQKKNKQTNQFKKSARRNNFGPIFRLEHSQTWVITEMYSLFLNFMFNSVFIVRFHRENDLTLIVADDVWKSILYSSYICVRHGLLQFKVSHGLHREERETVYIIFRYWPIIVAKYSFICYFILFGHVSILRFIGDLHLTHSPKYTKITSLLSHHCTLWSRQCVIISEQFANAISLV